MKKRVLFFLLVLMPMIARADSVRINGIWYNLDSINKVAEVTYGTSAVNTTRYTGNIVIPKSVYYGGETYSVTSIGDQAFYVCSNLTYVNIPNSVRSIGFSAFSGCSSLTSITIPNSVKTIRESAFSHCKGLTTISFPDSITYIEGGAFYSTAWYSNQPDGIIYIGNVLYCYKGTMPNNTEVIVKNGTVSISSGAFYNCTGLVSIEIPNSVTRIGPSAFFNCTSLKSIDIPNSITHIEAETFGACTGLKSIKIPSSVISIPQEEGPFFGCTGVTSITIDNDNKVYDSRNNCNAIIETLTNELIFGCETTSIPYGVKSIRFCAFYQCTGLTSVTFPNSVTYIGKEAFEGCAGLSSVCISNSVNTIDSNAFKNCSGLKDVFCSANNVPTAKENIFDGSNVGNATLHVPTSSIESYKSTSPWNKFKDIITIEEREKCATPTITILANGKLKVVCATEGATCITNITASNAEPLSDGEISLNTPLIVYTVTSYATKEGYNDSEVATATFQYEKTEGDMNGDGMLNITDVIHLVNMILGQ